MASLSPCSFFLLKFQTVYLVSFIFIAYPFISYYQYLYLIFIILSILLLGHSYLINIITWSFICYYQYYFQQTQNFALFSVEFSAFSFSFQHTKSSFISCLCSLSPMLFLFFSIFKSLHVLKHFYHIAKIFPSHRATLFSSFLLLMNFLRFYSISNFFIHLNSFFFQHLSFPFSTFD